MGKGKGEAPAYRRQAAPLQEEEGPWGKQIPHRHSHKRRGTGFGMTMEIEICNWAARPQRLILASRFSRDHRKTRGKTRTL